MNEEAKEIAKSAAENYADSIKTRALVQTIPYVGGPIDTLLAGKGSKIQQERLRKQFVAIHERLEKVEKVAPLDEEAFYDFAMEVMSQTVRTRSDEKRKLFANVMAHQLQHPDETEYAEIALRMISDLEMIHFKVLQVALNIPLGKHPFEDIRVFTVATGAPDAIGYRLPSLQEALPEYPLEALQLAASYLVAKGLLGDEGAGRYDARWLTYLVATPTADWLCRMLV